MGSDLSTDTREDPNPERPGRFRYSVDMSAPNRRAAVYVDGERVASGRRVELRAEVSGEGERR